MSPPKRTPSHRLFATALPFLIGTPAALLAAGILWAKFFRQPAALAETSGQPPSRSNDARLYADYGGSASCRECHVAEYSDWEHSHHGLAERKPVPALDDTAFIPTRTFTIGTQLTTVRTMKPKLPGNLLCMICHAPGSKIAPNIDSA